LFGSELFLVPKEEYARKGSAKLLEEAGERLKSEFGAQKPYLLPVGGSTVHGLFGYLECMRELEAQIEESGAEVDEIVFSCGSGGTATGLAVGKYLSTNPKIRNIKLTGYLACDSPEYFHEHVNEMLASIGLDQEVKSEDLLNFVQAKGIGYAINTPEELDVIRQVARTSGIVLDGSYTGKAITGFVNDQTRPEGTRCLFIHTGGIFSVIGNDELLKEQAK
jgi:1-aminocyclopropane-1-carboxylate deaminase/D-cysteine desulfhydrase-like pyridoxal-dependent ACC family enzyme